MLCQDHCESSGFWARPKDSVVVEGRDNGRPRRSIYYSVISEMGHTMGAGAPGAGEGEGGRRH